MTNSNDQTDVHVVSLDDRRKIRDLEASKADLERKLAEALGRVQPALTTERGECGHYGGYVVSDTDLRVSCKECEAEVDPYEVLRKISHREVNFCYTLNSLRKEAESLRAEVDKLKAARSRIRRRVRESEDVSPAGICAVLREHDLYSIHLAMQPGGGCGMAIAVPRGEAMRSSERGIRCDAGDIEAALTDLLAKLAARRSSAASDG